jgi:hypothetical protein
VPKTAVSDDADGFHMDDRSISFVGIGDNSDSANLVEEIGEGAKINCCFVKSVLAESVAVTVKL